MSTRASRRGTYHISCVLASQEAYFFSLHEEIRLDKSDRREIREKPSRAKEPRHSEFRCGIHGLCDIIFKITDFIQVKLCAIR